MTWDQTCKIRVGAHELAYHREGEGETLLFVHGITTNSFIWRPLVALLSDRYQVIALDLLGCGDSDQPLDVSYGIASHVERLHGFMEALGLGRVTLIGHDIGGGISQRFATQYPERLDRLVLMNTVGYDFWPVQPIITMRTPILRQLALAALDLGMFKLVVQRGVFHRKRVDDELMAQFWKPLRTPEGRKAFLHFAESLDNSDLTSITEALRALPMPVLVMRGQNDLYLPAAISETLHRDIPGSTLVEIREAGHFLQVDQPGAIARSLRAFLETAKPQKDI